MTDEQDPEVWRDENQLPLSELGKAMASWDTDGQGDATDGDSGAEQAFGHDDHVDQAEVSARTDPERPVRPSTTGRSGPH